MDTGTIITVVLLVANTVFAVFVGISLYTDPDAKKRRDYNRRVKGLGE